MSKLVIVAGGRDFNDYGRLKTYLDLKYPEPFELVEGGQITKPEDTKDNESTWYGADWLAKRYAKERDLICYTFNAHWKVYGKAAGPLRNERVAKFVAGKREDGELVAFWDGISKGTSNMIAHAKTHGLKIFIERY